MIRNLREKLSEFDIVKREFESEKNTRRVIERERDECIRIVKMLEMEKTSMSSRIEQLNSNSSRVTSDLHLKNENSLLRYYSTFKYY